MLSDQRQTSMLATGRGNDIEAGALGSAGLDIFCANIGRRTRAVHDHFAFKAAAELRNVFVICVEDGGPAGGKRLDQFVLGAGDTRQGVEELQVNGSDVGDDADLGLRDFRQRPDFSGVRHAHLDDCNVMLRF